MTCPFPGMDPYIERPAIWADFHDALITFIRSALQPLLRPNYVALGQDRLYVVESERPIFPDLAVVRTNSPMRPTGTGQGLMELDTPAIFELYREEIREPYLTIVEPAANNRVVTAIEVLSPKNKAPGEGRDAYLQKRDEYWDTGANLVEIDLLRTGEPTVRVSAERLATLSPWTYLVGVTRYRPPEQRVYAFPLNHRLPRIAVPLAARDDDVPLNLQAVFTQCWDSGPYPELLRYEDPPPGRLTKEELDWCDQRLKSAEYRGPS